MLPQETILRKRSGEPLTREEIARFIAGVTDGSVSEGQVAALAMAIWFKGMARDETVALTLAMRDSGEVLTWDLPGPVVDKHSTGGVGDNVSLMLAPMVAASGAYVPMISGRGLGHTGGTLDKMDSIPDYVSQPDNALFRKVVRGVGCAEIRQEIAHHRPRVLVELDEHPLRELAVAVPDGESQVEERASAPHAGRLREAGLRVLAALLVVAGELEQPVADGAVLFLVAEVGHARTSSAEAGASGPLARRARDPSRRCRFFQERKARSVSRNWRRISAASFGTSIASPYSAS